MKYYKIKINFYFFFLLAISFYIAFHLVWGERGLIKKAKLENHKSHKTAIISGLNIETSKIKQDIEILKDKDKNSDFIEHQAREILNLIDKNEVIITD